MNYLGLVGWLFAVAVMFGLLLSMCFVDYMERSNASDTIKIKLSPFKIKACAEYAGASACDHVHYEHGHLAAMDPVLFELVKRIAVKKDACVSTDTDCVTTYAEDHFGMVDESFGMNTSAAEASRFSVFSMFLFTLGLNLLLLVVLVHLLRIKAERDDNDPQKPRRKDRAYYWRTLLFIVINLSVALLITTIQVILSIQPHSGFHYVVGAMVVQFFFIGYLLCITLYAWAMFIEFLTKDEKYHKVN